MRLGSFTSPAGFMWPLSHCIRTRPTIDQVPLMQHACVLHLKHTLSHWVQTFTPGSRTHSNSLLQPASDVCKNVFDISCPSVVCIVHHF